MRLAVGESTRASALGRFCHHLGSPLVGHHRHSHFGRHGVSVVEGLWDQPHKAFKGRPV